MKYFSVFSLLFIIFCLSLRNAVPVLGKEIDLLTTKKEIVADSMYKTLELYNISTKCIDIAVQGYNKLLRRNKLQNKKYLTIIDMSRSSKQERLFIINTDTYKVIHKSLVAHGKNSGEEYATCFSNVPESKQTSLGLYLTAEIYTGQHGLSIRLDGLSPFNSKARERDIVIHSADYVSDHFIREYNRLGRSWGCPALPFNNYNFVVNTIKNGSCLFIYHPLISSSSKLLLPNA